MEHTLNINYSDEEALKAFAIITAKWIRQGLTFKMQHIGNVIRVTLTGGF